MKLTGKDRKRLEAFVRARTDELADVGVEAAHRALLALIDRMRKEAGEEAAWDLIGDIATGIFGDDDWADDLAEDALFDDDPEEQAAKLATAILAALALSHADHPDYDGGWRPSR